MELPADVNVYKLGYSKEVYRDMSQYVACEKSIQMLKVQMQTEEDYGDKYKALLQDRINQAQLTMANLEAKYASWVDPKVN